MKRDMDLIRQLLLQVEANPSPILGADLSIDGRSKDEVMYHCYLLIKAGLTEGNHTTTANGLDCHLVRLTWAGHEFLDVARNDTIWRKAVGTIKDKGLGIAFDVVKELLGRLVRSQVGL